MRGIGRRIDRLKALAGPPAETEREREERRKRVREERRKRVREQAEHANRYHEGEVLPFVVDEKGDVFASRDGKPITDPRQTLAEPWYWEEVEEWGGEGLVHDEEAEAFYARSGELAISRDRVDLRHLMGDARWEHLGGAYKSSHVAARRCPRTGAEVPFRGTMPDMETVPYKTV